MVACRSDAYKDIRELGDDRAGLQFATTCHRATSFEQHRDIYIYLEKDRDEYKRRGSGVGTNH